MVTKCSPCRSANVSRSSRRAIVPSSLATSQMTPDVERPASLAKSTAASVLAVRLTAISIDGGSIDAAMTAVAAIPLGLPLASRDVMIVTPAARPRIAPLSCWSRLGTAALTNQNRPAPLNDPYTNAHDCPRLKGVILLGNCMTGSKASECCAVPNERRPLNRFSPQPAS
ncbi:hypothetical protein J2W42_003293 [Rhizobium tibeticum]|nr:hypothetical protein [Rhizobium tibeticum]